MNALSLREAKATLSAVVKAAERGQATTITKYGRPVATVQPVERTTQPEPEGKPSFAELLLSIPCDFEYERDYAPMREIDW